MQYACNGYTVVLDRHGIQASMSRVGNPYDNAQAEQRDRGQRRFSPPKGSGLAYSDRYSRR